MDSDDVLHPGHRTIRLKHRDYRVPGPYFVTICTHLKSCTLGKIVDEARVLSPLGSIARETWNAIPKHFPNVTLHAFVIMPNHIHGLIGIGCQAEAQHAAPLQETDEIDTPGVVKGSLGAIVRSFKAAVTRRARVELQNSAEIWQRNYFERVVRDGQEFGEVCRYSAENPLMWGKDAENPEAARVTPGQAGAQHAAPLQSQGQRRRPWN